jgi:hypothetical protein
MPLMLWLEKRFFWRQLLGWKQQHTSLHDVGPAGDSIFWNMIVAWEMMIKQHDSAVRNFQIFRANGAIALPSRLEQCFLLGSSCWDEHNSLA